MQNRLVHAFSRFFNQVCQAALRVVLTSLLFTTCVVMVLRYLGVPMPSAYELLRQVEGLSTLAKIIS